MMFFDASCASICLPLFFHRAFGDKSTPPVIPVTDPSVQTEADMDGGESGGEETEDSTQNDAGMSTVESSFPNLQDLSLRDREIEEETEDVQDEQEDLRSPQGKLSQSTGICHVSILLEPGFTQKFWFYYFLFEHF